MSIDTPPSSEAEKTSSQGAPVQSQVGAPAPYGRASRVVLVVSLAVLATIAIWALVR